MTSPSNFYQKGDPRNSWILYRWSWPSGQSNRTMRKQETKGPRLEIQSVQSLTHVWLFTTLSKDSVWPITVSFLKIQSETHIPYIVETTRSTGTLWCWLPNRVPSLFTSLGLAAEYFQLDPKETWQTWVTDDRSLWETWSHIDMREQSNYVERRWS